MITFNSSVESFVQTHWKIWIKPNKWWFNIYFRTGVADLSFVYAGDNIGHGSVVIVPALSHPACGCDYRCVVLDEFCVNVRCICPEGWRLKKDNQTACERKFFIRFTVEISTTIIIH